MNNKKLFKKLPLAAALTAATLSAQAVEFQAGEVAIQWDNTITYGIAARTSDPDLNTVSSTGGQAVLGKPGKASSNNYDDGTLNYSNAGDIYTNALKYNTDLEISWKNYGGFFRARGFYDYQIMEEETDFKPLNQEAKNTAGYGYDLLDAFVWADYEFGETPVSFRVGRQVVSWGESTFIQGGINSINPVDASAFRKPGAEVKDGLLPVNMAFTSIGITPDLSLEAFYQLEWEKTRPDPCGTFFSTTDFATDGCNFVYLTSSIEERDLLASRDAEIAQGYAPNERLTPVTERMEDGTPKDSGQYGLALRWYSEALGDTEFGAYYMNIHSRLPYINGVVANRDGSTKINPNGSFDSSFPIYQIAYPEDIVISGLSFATTTADGGSLGGEISYRPDAPIQWNAFEVLYAGLNIPFSRLYQYRLEQAGGNTAENRQALAGEVAQGYDEFDIWQAQMTYIKLFDQVIGADRLSIAAEVGVTYVPDLPSKSEARFGRSGVYGIGSSVGIVEGTTNDFCLTGADAAGTAKNPNPDNCTNGGYTTPLSGGIRIRSGLTYNNLLLGSNVTPNIAIAYDKGNGPEPGAQFLNNRLTSSVGVKFDYQNQLQVSLSYTDFSGGNYNTAKDRDNVALSASYSF